MQSPPDPNRVTTMLRPEDHLRLRALMRQSHTLTQGIEIALTIGGIDLLRALLHFECARAKNAVAMIRYLVSPMPEPFQTEVVATWMVDLTAALPYAEEYGDALSTLAEFVRDKASSARMNHALARCAHDRDQKRDLTVTVIKSLSDPFATRAYCGRWDILTWWWLYVESFNLYLAAHNGDAAAYAMARFADIFAREYAR